MSFTIPKEIQDYIESRRHINPQLATTFAYNSAEGLLAMYFTDVNFSEGVANIALPVNEIVVYSYMNASWDIAGRMSAADLGLDQYRPLITNNMSVAEINGSLIVVSGMVEINKISLQACYKFADIHQFRRGLAIHSFEMFRNDAPPVPTNLLKNNIRASKAVTVVSGFVPCKEDPMAEPKVKLNLRPRNLGSLHTIKVKELPKDLVNILSNLYNDTLLITAVAVHDFNRLVAIDRIDALGAGAVDKNFVEVWAKASSGTWVNIHKWSYVECGVEQGLYPTDSHLRFVFHIDRLWLVTQHTVMSADGSLETETPKLIGPRFEIDVPKSLEKIMTPVQDNQAEVNEEKILVTSMNPIPDEIVEAISAQGVESIIHHVRFSRDATLVALDRSTNLRSNYSAAGNFIEIWSKTDNTWSLLRSWTHQQCGVRDNMAVTRTIVNLVVRGNKLWIEVQFTVNKTDVALGEERPSTVTWKAEVFESTESKTQIFTEADVGREVSCPKFGLGKIIGFEHGPVFPVVVEFNEGGRRFFSTEGRDSINRMNAVYNIRFTEPTEKEPESKHEVQNNWLRDPILNMGDDFFNLRPEPTKKPAPEDVVIPVGLVNTVNGVFKAKNVIMNCACTTNKVMYVIDRRIKDDVYNRAASFIEVWLYNRSRDQWTLWKSWAHKDCGVGDLEVGEVNLLIAGIDDTHAELYTTFVMMNDSSKKDNSIRTLLSFHAKIDLNKPMNTQATEQ